jgi:hypothetical protein
MNYSSPAKPLALAGLCDFSHVEVRFHMDQVDPSKVEKTARHPRNNTEWPKVGIFAQRGKDRPNQIGTTICKILRVDGLRIYLVLPAIRWEVQCPTELTIGKEDYAFSFPLVTVDVSGS